MVQAHSMENRESRYKGRFSTGPRQVKTKGKRIPSRWFQGFLLCFVLLTVVSCDMQTPPSSSRRLEKDYQFQWCREQGGAIEVELPDGTRCDCLTATHAIEFDFARKWAEAIGQALYYSDQTGRRPGIVLIMNPRTDQRYWQRLQATIRRFNLPIDVWQVRR